MFETLIEFTNLSAEDLLICAGAMLLAGLVRGFAGFALSAILMASIVFILPPVELIPLCYFLEAAASISMLRGGLKDADIVMMLRLQTERMQGAFVPSVREYFHLFGLDQNKLKVAKPDALIMHPGPMNRGVEIDSEIADDLNISAISEQVEMGVAVRMACLDVLTRGDAE